MTPSASHTTSYTATATATHTQVVTNQPVDYAGYLDDGDVNIMSIHCYTIYPDTTVTLYGVPTLDTWIGGGTLLPTTLYPQAGTALEIYPTTYTETKGDGVSDMYCKIEATRPVLWEFYTHVSSAPDADQATWLHSTNRTKFGGSFYTYMAGGNESFSSNPGDGSGYGDSCAVLNPLPIDVTVSVYKGGGRGAGGTSWTFMGQQVISPESIWMFGGSLADDVCEEGPGTGGFEGTKATAAKDVMIKAINGDVMVWKGNIFACYELDNNEPNDHAAYGVSTEWGTSVGNNIYMAVGTNDVTSANGIVVTGIGGATYDIERYVPIAGTGTDLAHPIEGAAGNWVAWLSGQNVAAGLSNAHPVSNADATPPGHSSV